MSGPATFENIGRIAGLQEAAVDLRWHASVFRSVTPDTVMTPQEVADVLESIAAVADRKAEQVRIMEGVAA